MENRVKKNNLLLFGYVVLGYFIGTTIFELLNLEHSIYQAFSGFLGSLSLSIVFVLTQRFKYPELKQKEIQLIQDERNIQIEGKASVYTLYLVGTLILILIVAGTIMNIVWLKYGGAVLFLLIYGFNRIVILILQKKM
jgi:hypothetical protein